MHAFDELVEQSSTYILSTLKETEDYVVEQLQTSGATRFVKTLQMIQLHKAIMAVGMFSTFEASLQKRLACENGFKEVRDLLDRWGEVELKKRFQQFADAVNVLKHGRGSSYGRLLTQIDDLPFRVKGADESFFAEGDVSEVSTLVKVDDDFVIACAEVIKAVSDRIREARS